MTEPFLNVVVYGRPIAQGSKKGFRRGKGVQVVDDNKDVLFPWREAMTERMRGCQDPAMTGPVRAVALFAIAPPAKVPADRLGWPCVAPDTDKYQRALGDAITDAGAFKDDGQIVTWTATKMYVGQAGNPMPRPGVWVRLYRIGA